MQRLLALALATVVALASQAQPLTVRDIRVATTLATSGGGLASDVKIVDTTDGVRVIEVTLANRSGRDVELLSAEVEFPWVAPGGAAFRVAAGGMSSGRWPPTLVFDPARSRAEPVSGTYLMTRGDQGSLLAAFVSWRTFWSKLHYRGGRVVVSVDGESRRIRVGETVALEKVRLAAGDDWQDLLYNYARAITREVDFTPKPPRRFLGWSTWDYYGRDFPAAAVRGNVDAVQRLLPEANLIQLDGGWWRERGDYGGVREDLGEDGMKRFAAEFRERGLTAGLHLDGVRFSPDSNIVREHPEYFLHDDRGELLRELRSVNGQVLHVFVDYSHPGACAYMRDSLRRLRREWGFDYFKVDFLRSIVAEDVRRDAIPPASPRKIAPFDPGLTSIERFHRAMNAIREGIGEDAYLVGCSTPFGPTFGHVDALRTGPDISPRFAAYVTQSQANAGNFHLQGIVIQSDPDYLVVRGREDQDATLVKDRNKDGGSLALNEAEMWATYVAMCGAPVLASDNLMILREERKELVRFAAAQAVCTRFVPLDFWERASSRTDAFQVFLSGADNTASLILFNWDDRIATYTVRGLSGRPTLVRGISEIASDGVGNTQLTVPPRHAASWRLPVDTTFEAARKTIRLGATGAESH